MTLIIIYFCAALFLVSYLFISDLKQIGKFSKAIFELEQIPAGTERMAYAYKLFGSRGVFIDEILSYDDKDTRIFVAKYRGLLPY